jgi:hypothetical protein
MERQHGGLNMILHCQLEKNKIVDQVLEGLSMPQQTNQNS